MASPSSINELTGQQTIPQAPEREDAAEQDALVAGDSRLDLRTRRATVRGQELLLTPEEFEMLVFLTGRRTSVITPHTRWGTSQVRQAEFLRVLGQLGEKLASTQGCTRCLRTEPWAVCRFDPHNRDEVH
jgi:DNA-binding response OmpR family regulator